MRLYVYAYIFMHKCMYVGIHGYLYVGTYIQRLLGTWFHIHTSNVAAILKTATYLTDFYIVLHCLTHFYDILIIYKDLRK